MYSSYFKEIEALREHPITLDGAKLHLQETESDNDPLINVYIEAATRFVENYCRITLMPTVYEERMDEWPSDGIWELRKYPFIQIESITYIDTEGDTQTLSSSLYSTSIKHTIPYIYLIDSATTIDHKDTTDAIRVRYRAGYQASGIIPYDIIAAMLLMIRKWYDKREDNKDGLGFNDLVPNASINLLLPHKRHEQ